jgi:presenilin-like A22 family membrane protease
MKTNPYKTTLSQLYIYITMKHKTSITFILLGMFLLAQIVGLLIIDKGVVPEMFNYDSDLQGPMSTFFSMILSFIIAITIFLFLIKYKWKLFLKIWFGLVILLTLAIVINSIFYMNGFQGNIYFYYSLLIALPLVILKIIRPSIIIHNLTEIFIYAGLALVFVNILTPLLIIFLLILISFYDMWAVWHSGIMQKMAKFQMSEMKIFNGFLIPYLTKEMKTKLDLAKKRKERIKINVPIALLGGGDIAFTLIPAGVFLKYFGWIPAIYIVCGGFIGLTYLLFRSEKKKFYPAMPFITLGIFSSLVLYFIIHILIM